ncbi:MAG: lysylphosphatidylglycerol synthase transmembrane domain-containing protein [Chloroflexota bacterium]
MPLRSIEFLSIKRTVLIMMIGLLVFGLYFYLSVDADDLLAFLRGVDSVQFIFLYSMALVLVILSVYFWTLAWKNILQQLSISISTRKLFLIYWTGYFMDLIVPLERIAGDLIRIYLLKKQTKTCYATLISSTIIDRVIAYFAVISGLIFATIILLIYNTPTSILATFAVIFAFALTYFIILLYLAFNKGASKNIAKLYIRIRRLIRRKNDQNNIEVNTAKSLATFYKGLEPFRQNIKAFKKPVIYHAIAYFLRIAVYFLIFYSLGLVFLPVAFFIVVYFLGSAVQDAIGSFSVGSLDILLIALFSVFGIESGATGIGALLLRSADFWFPLVVALIFIQYMGVRNIIMRIPKKKS